MSAGALLIPVNPCYFPRMRNTGDANPSAVHCNIWAGALVNNKGKYKRARHTLSPYFCTTHGILEVIPIAAVHASQSPPRRNKAEQAGAPTERGVRHC
jgi:hypothetical protein